ncbi:50S ribosomal protein L11 methyltransferase [Pinisolibacter aquiterrae]|uniref:50S ribosomal protein L11 methyltransferase n=1 Tax=Pinisolibacter aquiterrae TaxID=2815579 RepID=UPI001C3C7E9C|nr:50S ribosomal protein L11 methyltransferase [Pinisolibacter aquiterrae]MBV5263252.1 50S ribosomal protein L11 methyltransferase [Pinisolibacter aquiterrae]MCC8237670.1 50S ribosomal protein L11 methyltransferase [Pinisolibacter aquiterrae]
MPAVQVRLVAEGPESERLERLLGEAFEDEGYPVTREETVPYSEIWSVDTLVFDAESEEQAADLIRDALGTDAFTAPLTTSVLDLDANWVAMSEEIRHPVQAGRFYVHGSHDRHRRPPSGISIEIDAEMAFGTGHHATTWCCLMALDRLLKARRFERPLDLGTGTAVLAIAAARVLRVPVIATDIDPVAVRIAARNAHLNGVGAEVRCIVADGMKARLLDTEGPYDLVLANILARPLTKLAFPVAAQLARRSVVILSGLRTIERQLVLAAWASQGLRLAFEVERDGWLALVLETGDR